MLYYTSVAEIKKRCVKTNSAGKRQAKERKNNKTKHELDKKCLSLER